MLLQLASSSYAPPSRASVRMQQGMADMNQPELKSPLPWMERPTYLDGTLAGDVGFDPLSFTTKYSEGVKFSLLLNEFDSKDTEFIFGPNTQDAKRSLMWMREAEVKHARLAMLAAAGWPLAELWHGGLSRLLGLPYALEATQGRSLSVLNGGLGEVAPFLFLVFLAISAVEVSTLDQVYGLTATGATMKKDGRVVMKSYTPGDCGFDPLNLYGWYGSQMPVMVKLEADADPEYRMRWEANARKEMETAEIKNGRLAMLAITGYAFQEFVWGTPVVDQTPIFFTFFGDVLAPGALGSTFPQLAF
jgi:light-harvesting complex II chlorophyll a/b binding protein 4